MFRKCLIQGLILVLIVAGIAACSKRSVSEETASESTHTRQEGKYLAYEHTISIDIREETLEKAFKATVDFCLGDKDNDCTILDSEISKGTYPSASIRLRIVPGGVKGIIATASNNGKIVQQSTHVEDLAKPVQDNAERLKMLESYRDNLFLLQEKAQNDIDSLIKISSELSKIQSELEQKRGDEVYLSQRITMEVVKIQYHVNLNRLFWKPIFNALSRFSHNLADGISTTIVAIAYLLPATLIFIFGFAVVRIVRKRGRKG